MYRVYCTLSLTEIIQQVIHFNFAVMRKKNSNSVSTKAPARAEFVCSNSIYKFRFMDFEFVWDFEYMDDNGNLRYTGTSQKLLAEVSYPLQMDQIIDGKITFGRVPVDQLFVPQTSSAAGNEQFHESRDFEYDANDYSDDYPEELDTAPAPGNHSNVVSASDSNEASAASPAPVSSSGAPRYSGRIVQLKNGYGFIAPENSVKNLFFFWEDLVDCDFNELQCGDDVEYELGRNMRGECAKNIVLL